MSFLSVQVTAGASRDQVTRLDDEHYQVRTTKPARDNQANLAVIKLLAKHLRLPKSRLLIVNGEQSRHKRVQILD